VRGGRAGPFHFLIFLDWPARNSSSAVGVIRRGKFWSRREKESENRSSKDAAQSPRVRARRFDFTAAFYAVFNLTLLFFLDRLLIFRDDIAGAAAPRRWTAWHFHHRAGPAPQERAPRPSECRTTFRACVATADLCRARLQPCRNACRIHPALAAGLFEIDLSYKLFSLLVFRSEIAGVQEAKNFWNG
jgi:hypothetical protein